MLMNMDFQHEFHASQVPPEWHSWIHHIRQSPPTEDAVVKSVTPPWQAVSLRTIIIVNVSLKVSSSRGWRTSLAPGVLSRRITPLRRRFSLGSRRSQHEVLRALYRPTYTTLVLQSSPSHNRRSAHYTAFLESAPCCSTISATILPKARLEVSPGLSIPKSEIIGQFPLTLDG